MSLLRTADDLDRRVQEMGFLPFFRNSIPGFSVEEMADPDLWFAKDIDGPWEWKGPVVRRRHCAYGKFYAGKAMYISRRWFAPFMAWRRAQRPLDTIGHGGISSAIVMQTIVDEGSALSSDLKKMFEAVPRRKRTASDLVDLTGLADVEYKANRNALERVLTSLQMSTHIAIDDFEYAVSRTGQPYGWGLARYSTPGYILGEDYVDEALSLNPALAIKEMSEYLHKLLPAASERQIRSLLY